MILGIMNTKTIHPKSDALCLTPRDFYQKLVTTMNFECFEFDFSEFS